MNVCPYAHESTTCGLLSPEVDGTIAYCNQCFQFAFRCAAGHWNRAFARYCTHCSQELEKPAQWGMASGNPQRTGILPQMPSIDEGFGSWVASIPEIESGANLPGLLAIDGLIVVPNPRERKLDAYTIVNDSNQENLNLRWSISFNSELTYGSTPIYHGLHLYSVVSGGIQKTSVIDGETELINNINGVDAAQIEPLPSCAPVKCDVNGNPTMVAGLNRGMLLFNFASEVPVNTSNTISLQRQTHRCPLRFVVNISFSRLGAEIFLFLILVQHHLEYAAYPRKKCRFRHLFRSTVWSILKR